MKYRAATGAAHGREAALRYIHTHTPADVAAEHTNRAANYRANPVLPGGYTAAWRIAYLSTLAAAHR